MWNNLRPLKYYAIMLTYVTYSVIIEVNFNVKLNRIDNQKHIKNNILDLPF